MYGAAVGDALGVPYECMERGTFECEGMVGGGAHGMPAGTFSDDTSLMLATCDGIRACGGIDVDDMRSRFRAWLYEGAYTADGSAFDVGNATATAIEQGRGCDGERSSGNGSLMRIAPLALTTASDDEIRDASAVTHAHVISKEACVAFVHILREVLRGEALATAIEGNIPDDPRFGFMHDIESWSRDDVRSTGYVIDTLGAALWCALNTDDYQLRSCRGESRGRLRHDRLRRGSPGRCDVRLRLNPQGVDRAASRKGRDRGLARVVVLGRARLWTGL